jgi:hypothetical protein
MIASSGRKIPRIAGEFMDLRSHYGEHGLLIVDRRHVAVGGLGRESVNPATKEPRGQVPQPTPEQVAEGIAAADRRRERLRALTAWKRSQLLRRVAQRVKVLQQASRVHNTFRSPNAELCW